MSASGQPPDSPLRHWCKDMRLRAEQGLLRLRPGVEMGPGRGAGPETVALGLLGPSAFRPGRPKEEHFRPLCKDRSRAQFPHTSELSRDQQTSSLILTPNLPPWGRRARTAVLRGVESRV